MDEVEWEPVRRQLRIVEQKALQKLCMVSMLCLDRSEARVDARATDGLRLADNDMHVQRVAWTAIHDLTSPGPAAASRAMASCTRAVRGPSAATLGPVGKDLLADVLRDLRDIAAIRILLDMEPGQRMDAPAYRHRVEAMVGEAVAISDQADAVAEVYMGYHCFMGAACKRLRFLSNTEVRRVLDSGLIVPPRTRKVINRRNGKQPQAHAADFIEDADDGTADDALPHPIGWGRPEHSLLLPPPGPWPPPQQAWLLPGGWWPWSGPWPPLGGGCHDANPPTTGSE